MPTIVFKKLFELSPNPYMLLDRNLCYVAANSAYLQATNSRWEDLVGRHVFDAFPDVPDDPDTMGVRMLRASLERVLQEAKPDTIALIPYRVPRSTADGIVNEERYWSATHTPVLDEAGAVQFILQHTVDLTELHRLKAAVRKAEDALDGDLPPQLEAGVLQRAEHVQAANLALDIERRHLRRLFEQAPGFVCFLRGNKHQFELVNLAYRKLVGHRDIEGKPAAQALPETVEQGYIDLLDRVFTTGEPFIGRQMRILLQQQPEAVLEEVIVDFVYQPIIEPDGSVSGIFVQGHDVTEQVRAQEELRKYRETLEVLVQERTRALEASEAERAQAEAALRQAQKMEAVGKLTGGVAHDFNNLLQVISSNLQLLQVDTQDDPRSQRRLQNAMNAVDRGARLAIQLLAFARRQPLEPTVLNLGRLVRGMDDLLRHALGERVAVETVIGGGLWNTVVDPNQVENAILNLAINARDAMDGEGKLTIEAGNAMLDDRYAAQHADVAPGQYVMLAISDTGCGMTPEVLERAFDPFYTTKREGEGTGLGLSMVYGFIKQSGGHVKIYSEVGHGTTIKLYLPRSVEAESPVPERVSGPVEGGTETILVVEDDPEVRDAAVEMLVGLGYRVLKASNGQGALHILQSGLAIDLLFTDVVMPGPVQSTELAKQAKAMLPNIEVLFTSGYTENAIVHGGRLDPGVKLLGKPYRREDLARKVRHMFRNRAQRIAATTAPTAAAAPMPDSPAATAEAEPRLRILFVEDDDDIRITIVQFLEELGHEVVAAAQAEPALEWFREGRFDVLFTDVSLPGMSGMQLAQEVQRLRPGFPVIVASGYRLEHEEGQPKCVYLVKPYSLDDCKNLLREVSRRTAEFG